MDPRPIIVISDVHENIFWKEALKAREPGDRVIFLGDYFDRRGHGPFAEDPIANFLEICAYAESNPDTILLVGNHDYMYMPWSIQINDWDDRDLAIQKAVMGKIDLLKMAWLDDASGRPLLFSHAGVTQTFLDIHGLKDADDINRLWLEKPEAFEWQMTDPAKTVLSDRYGDDPWQSPIWVRTRSLYEDGAKGFHQIVGHTPVEKTGLFALKNGQTCLLTCDFSGETIKLVP